MEINIQNTKIELIQWIAGLEDVSLINRIVEIRKKQSENWWKNLSDAEKKSIEKGISDAESGSVFPHSKAREIYEKYL